MTLRRSLPIQMPSSDVIGEMIQFRKKIPAKVDRRTHDTVRIVHQTTVDALLFMERQAVVAGGNPMACRRGCAACCTYPAQVAPEEASILADAVQAMPRAQRESVIARMAAWERAWAANKMGDLADVGPWQARRIACPLLDLKTHDCMVYEDRPLACRAHHAVTPPPDAKHPSCDTCSIAMPPDGCFTTDEEISHNHRTPVWQYDPNLGNRSLYSLSLLLNKQTVEAGFLVPLTLGVGRARYGWQNPKKMIKLDVLNSTFPSP